MTHSFGSTLKPAAFRGRLCFGPNRGRNVTFARPDQWIGEWTTVDPEEAMTELLRRFLATNGPATREEVARWWAITPATATRYRKRLGDEVADVEVEGTAAWMLAADVDKAAKAKPAKTVNLLPAFDQYVIGAPRRRPTCCPGPFRDRVHRPQGWISPVLLVNGRMDGVWRHERKGARLEVTIEPFVGVPRGRARRPRRRLPTGRVPRRRGRGHLGLTDVPGPDTQAGRSGQLMAGRGGRTRSWPCPTSARSGDPRQRPPGGCTASSRSTGSRAR